MSPSSDLACAECLRRSCLLCALSGVLDCCAGDHERLLALLALSDDELLSALGGRRTGSLRARYEQLRTVEQAGVGGPSLCRHHPAYPSSLHGPAAPHALILAGARASLSALEGTPVVALVGTRAPSDYGRELARSLARSLAARGVCVLALLVEGVAAAAHAGALEVGGAGVAVLTGGHEVACPTALEGLYAHISQSGCAIAELPAGCQGRRWGVLAAERIVAALAHVTVVVECESSSRALAGARMAQAFGGTVAAIPGRVSSPLAAGSHLLLREGARLVRGSDDVLELVHAAGVPSPPAHSSASPNRDDAGRPALSPALLRTLELVRSGWDTPDALVTRGQDPWQSLHQLSELELKGLLARGRGGRYVSTPT